jgi:hypothetical protein
MRIGVLTLVVALALPGVQPIVAAATHLALAHPLDFVLQSGVFPSDSTQDLVGSAADPGYEDLPLTPDLVGFLVFQLPEPGPGESMTVQHAQLSVRVAEVKEDPTFSLDLYALPSARTATGLDLYNLDAPYDPTPDLYVGPSNTRRSTSDYLIQPEFMGPLTAPPSWATTSDEAGTALADHLSQLYADGGAGQYALFRLNPNISVSELEYKRMGYILDFAGVAGDSWSDEQVRPRLEITFAPEPSFAAVAGAAMWLLASRRKRQGRR